MGNPDLPGFCGTDLVLAVNAGSSSVKCALFGALDSDSDFRTGETSRSNAPFRALERLNLVTAPGIESHLIEEIQVLVDRHSPRDKSNQLCGVGHRMVHGGTRFTNATFLTAEVLSDLRQLAPLAPEHERAELDLIAALAERFPSVPQIACFDTAFHRNLPVRAQMLPIPRRYYDSGIRRFGFHGLSYEFLMGELARLGDPAAISGRVVLAHLGSGASLAAVRDGECIDTSMAFTPAAGLVMGRRSGDLDPGLAPYLARTEDMTPERFDELVNHESGLLGISETSSDLRELLVAESKDSRAADAIELFSYQVTKWIGAFAAAMGGIDTLVFSGGIGEHCASVRQRICRNLGFLGFDFDQERNLADEGVISADGSRVTLRVIPTDEEWIIAQSVFRLLGPGREDGK